MFINCGRLNEGCLDNSSKKVRQQRFSEGEVLRKKPSVENVTEWKAEKRQLRTNTKWEKLRQ